MEYQFRNARDISGSSRRTAMPAGISRINLLQDLQEYRAG